MEVGTFLVNVTSEQPEALSTFYREVVGLPVNTDMGESAFLVGGSTFIIDGHSETHGPTKEPERWLINFFVDDLAAEQTRLEAQGVRRLRRAAHQAPHRRPGIGHAGAQALFGPWRRIARHHLQTAGETTRRPTRADHPRADHRDTPDFGPLPCRHDQIPYTKGR